MRDRNSFELNLEGKCSEAGVLSETQPYWSLEGSYDHTQCGEREAKNQFRVQIWLAEAGQNIGSTRQEENNEEKS